MADFRKALTLNPVVDGYGVGTSISNAPTVDFAFDIVEIEGQPIAKRGKRSGAKQVWRCPACSQSQVTLRGSGEMTCACGHAMTQLLKPLIDDGKIVCDFPPAQTIRQHVLDQLAALRNSLEA